MRNQGRFSKSPHGDGARGEEERGAGGANIVGPRSIAKSRQDNASQSRERDGLKCGDEKKNRLVKKGARPWPLGLRNEVMMTRRQGK